MTAINSTGYSSAKYGPCICGEHASEVFVRNVNGWHAFGHQECLEGPTDVIERQAREFDAAHHGRSR